MNVRELNKEQLIELKQRYLMDKQGNVSWGELACVDMIVPDEEVFQKYEGVYFVEADFD